MSKKTIIWAVVIGVLINIFVLPKLTYHIECYGNKPGFEVFKYKTGTKIEPPTTPTTIDFGVPLCPTSGWPLQVNLANSNSIKFWLPFLINITFWSFFVWIVLTLVNRIKHKQKSNI